MMIYIFVHQYNLLVVGLRVVFFVPVDEDVRLVVLGVDADGRFVVFGVDLRDDTQLVFGR